MLSRHWVRLGCPCLLLTLIIFLSSCGIDADNPPTLPRLGDDSYRVDIEFTSALNLPAQAKVLSAGAPVGTVTNVQYDAGRAVVQTAIDDTAVVSAQSRAELRQDTLLGEIYVAILPPITTTPAAGDALAPGAVIPLSRTEPAANVEDVMRGMANILGGGELDKIHTAISTLNATFPQDEREFGELYDTTLRTLSDVSRNTGQLDRILESTNRTLRTVLNDPNGIDRMLDKGGRNFSGLGTSLVEVALLIANLRSFSVSTGRIVNPEYERLTQSIGAITPVIRSISTSDITSQRVVRSATNLLRDKLIPLASAPSMNVSEFSVDGREMAYGSADSVIMVLRSIGMLP